MSPAVGDVAGFAAAIAAYPAGADGLRLSWSPEARECAERSLERHGLLLVGEIHGVAETPLVIESLVAALGIRTVALEWPCGLETAIGDLARLGSGPELGRPIVDADAFEHAVVHAWCGDGRVTAGHFAVLGRLGVRVVGVDAAFAPPGEDGRDAVMARGLERVLTVGPRPVLFVAGNTHTRQTHHAAGLPAGARLASERPDLCTLDLHLRRGRFWNLGPRVVGPWPPPAGPHIVLEEVTEAVVLATRSPSAAVTLRHALATVTVTLQQLRYFLAAVERGSVSGAAEACFVSQPSLSEQLRRLEKVLGVALFVRTNRGLILTDAGRLLVPRAERAVAAARDAEEAVRAAGAIVSGTVAFGTFSTAHHHVLGAAIAEFRAHHPGVRLRVLSRNSTEIADAVRRGELEAGLVALPVDERGLVIGDRVWATEAVYVTSDRGRLRGEPRSVQQVAAAQLVLPEALAGDDDPTRRQLSERAADAGVRIEPVVEVESPAAALDLVARGVGDTVASVALVHRLGLQDRLAWAPLDPPLLERFAFVTPRGATLSPATRALIASVESNLELDIEPEQPSLP